MTSSSPIPDPTGPLGAVANMRFGPGVLRPIGVALCVLEVLLAPLAGIMAFRDTAVMLIVVGLMAGLFVLYLIGGFIYAHTQPQAAALASADWTQVLTQDTSMKALPGGPAIEGTARLVQNPQIASAKEPGDA